MQPRVRIGFVVAGLAASAWAGLALWRASRAVDLAERDVASAVQLRFTLSELHPVITGVEQISAPAQFQDGAIFKGHLYAAGPAGLFADGVEYRTGALLPPAPLTSMTQAVTSLAAEPELWIGTAGEGMLAFDGSKFRHLRPTDAKVRKVTAVLGLPGGRVLFGTHAGLLTFDGRSLTYLHMGLRAIRVTALAGNETDLWIGTLDRGLLHWRGGQVSVVSKLPDPHVLSVAMGLDGEVYAGTALGIAVVRNEAIERIIGDGLFAKTLVVHGERLYAGTIDPGLHEIPLRGGRPHLIETPSAVHRLFSAEGRLFAAADEGIFDARPWAPMLKPAGAVLTDRNISALSVDRDGKLWVGYFDRGLDIVDPGFARARHVEDQHLFCVNRIVHGPTTAVATANGLVLFDASGQKRQVLGKEQGVIANHVTDVVFSGEDMIAATPAGLSFIARDGIRSLYAFHGLVNNHAYALGVVGDRLMAGTLGGLSVLESGTVRVSYTTSNSPLRHNWVTAIAPSGSDAFVGTYGAGVIQLSADGTWRTFPDAGAPVEINPGAMAATSDRVYAGTLERGLMIYDRPGARWHTMTQGLPSLNVTAVHIAGERVFVGTDNGLVRLP